MQRIVLIIILDLLQLTRERTVGKNNAIPTEVTVMRAVTKITAIAKDILPIATAEANRLVDKIPNKATLIAFVFIGQVCIQMHTADRITHRMRVLAADKGFLTVL